VTVSRKKESVTAKLNAKTSLTKDSTSAVSKTSGTTTTSVVDVKRTNSNVLTLSASKIPVFAMANHNAWISLMRATNSVVSKDSTNTLQKSADVILSLSSHAKTVIVLPTPNSVTVKLNVAMVLMKVLNSAASKASNHTIQRTAVALSPNGLVNLATNASLFPNVVMVRLIVMMVLMKVLPITVNAASRASSSTTEKFAAATQLPNGPVTMVVVSLNLNIVTVNHSVMISLMKTVKSAAGTVTNIMTEKNVVATQLLT